MCSLRKMGICFGHHGCHVEDRHCYAAYTHEPCNKRHTCHHQSFCKHKVMNRPLSHTFPTTNPSNYLSYNPPPPAYNSSSSNYTSPSAYNSPTAYTSPPPAYNSPLAYNSPTAYTSSPAYNSPPPAYNSPPPAYKSSSTMYNSSSVAYSSGSRLPSRVISPPSFSSS